MDAPVHEAVAPVSAAVVSVNFGLAVPVEVPDEAARVPAKLAEVLGVGVVKVRGGLGVEVDF